MKYVFLSTILLACSLLKAQTSYSLNTKPIYGVSNSSSVKMYLPYFALLPKLKYEFGSISSVNLGLSWIDYLGDDVVDIPAWYHHGPFVESGISFKNNHQFMMNKLGYEYFYLIFGGRLNVIHQTNFSSNQFSIRPELGISLFSYVTFTYGYNINLNQSDLGLTNGNVFSLNIAYVISKDEK
jgi:hypothetical protein